MEETLSRNSNEKLARIVSGLETDAKHFVVNGESADQLLKNEIKERFNSQVEQITEKFKTDELRLDKYIDTLKDNINNLEIKAIGNNIIVKPYESNPFQKVEVSKSGIITSLGGYTPIVKSNETGDYQEEENFIEVAEVVDAGPDTKYIKEGDVVFYNKNSFQYIPFFRQGLKLVNETRIIAVVNEHLTERFKNC